MKRILLIIVISATFIVSAVYAADCYYQPGDNNDSGDTDYGSLICSEQLINQFWDHFGFDEGDWDDGFGYHDACNINKPLARTFNALYLLAYSAEDYARSTNDFNGNALRWAYPYSASAINDLDGRCGDNSRVAASTTRAVFWSWITLKWPFFYRMNVIQRAGAIVHEARHADGNRHNGGSACLAGASCDSEWTYYGANTYQILYLWWFSVDGTRTTTAMKDLAKREAQIRIDRFFVTTPPYSL